MNGLHSLDNIVHPLECLYVWYSVLLVDHMIHIHTQTDFVYAELFKLFAEVHTLLSTQHTYSER